MPAPATRTAGRLGPVIDPRSAATRCLPRVVVWNKTRKRDPWGVKHQQSRPERDWLRVEVPDLAIIDESLWVAAHAAMSQQRARFSSERRFRSPGRPSGTDGVDTRYLLTGLLQCGQCGGGMEVRTRSHGSRRVPFVGCASFHRRGARVCQTNLTVPEIHANAAVLEELKSSLLNQRVLEAAVERAVAILCQPVAWRRRRAPNVRTPRNCSASASARKTPVSGPKRRSAH